MAKTLKTVESFASIPDDKQRSVALFNEMGKVITHAQLLKTVWGPNAARETHYLRVYMAQIRRKLEDASPIVTVWGVGYKVASDRTAATI